MNFKDLMLSDQVLLIIGMHDYYGRECSDKDIIDCLNTNHINANAQKTKKAIGKLLKCKYIKHDQQFGPSDPQPYYILDEKGEKAVERIIETDLKYPHKDSDSAIDSFYSDLENDSIIDTTPGAILADAVMKVINDLQEAEDKGFVPGQKWCSKTREALSEALHMHECIKN